VNIGFARKGIPKKKKWQEVWSPTGKNQMWVPEWTGQQIKMMIHVGKEIIAKYPNIKIRDHHGHHDICPGYKEDPSYLFPFAEVLSGIYDQEVPDIWTPFLDVEPRQKAMMLLGYDLGKWGADGDWGRMSDAALRKFQKDHGMVANGYWSTFVCWEVYDELCRRGKTLEDLWFYGIDGRPN
jgi:N-acetyl-anhydromuramyl-L-alanine amidase AmpD